MKIYTDLLASVGLSTAPLGWCSLAGTSVHSMLRRPRVAWEGRTGKWFCTQAGPRAPHPDLPKFVVKQSLWVSSL